jgi:hypothetical protein
VLGAERAPAKGLSIHGSAIRETFDMHQKESHPTGGKSGAMINEG